MYNPTLEYSKKKRKVRSMKKRLLALLLTAVMLLSLSATALAAEVR